MSIVNRRHQQQSIEEEQQNCNELSPLASSSDLLILSSSSLWIWDGAVAPFSCVQGRDAAKRKEQSSFCLLLQNWRMGSLGGWGRGGHDNSVLGSAWLLYSGLALNTGAALGLRHGSSCARRVFKFTLILSEHLSSGRGRNPTRLKLTSDKWKSGPCWLLSPQI